MYLTFLLFLCKVSLIRVFFDHLDQKGCVMNKSVFARFIIICSVFFVCTGCGYNDVIDADQAVKAQWANVENQYQRRSDLIPNLVNVVKGSAAFEKDTLTAVTEARASAGQVKLTAEDLNDPEKMKRFEEAQDRLKGSLSRLMVVVEKYPELKSTGQFRDLQAQLEGTENRIAVERRKFNNAVAEYNGIVLRFPSSIGSKLRGMTERPAFKATAGADKAPEVKF